MIRDVDEVLTTYTVHQLCLTGRSQADNSMVDTVKSQQSGSTSPSQGQSPRAPPRIHFRPLLSRPAKDDKNQVPHAKRRGNTSHTDRSKAQRETPDHHSSHIPGSGTNVGHYKQTIQPTLGIPHEHDSTPRRLVSVHP